MNIFFRFSILSVCYVVSLIGCTPWHSPRLPGLEGFQAVSLTEKADIHSAISRHADSLKTGRVLAETRIARGLGSEQFRQVFVFQNPFKLRAELFITEVNRLAVLIVADEHWIEGLYPSDGVLYRGVASRTNFERLLSVPFEPRELMCWVFGRIDVPKTLSSNKLSVLRNNESKQFAIRYVFDRKLFQALFQPIRSVITNQTEYQLTSLAIEDLDMQSVIFLSRITYPTEDSSYPSTIEFELPRVELRGTMNFLRHVENPDLSVSASRLFEIRQIDGVRIENLDEP